nr:hypothetical protein [Thiocapsa imhoffii]
MDMTSIDLRGSEIDSIECREGVLRVHFSRAYLIKTMTGSKERTRWWQAGDLILEEASLSSGIPAAPLIGRGGDIEENIYTYRDMIPVPLTSRGHARVLLHFEGSDTSLDAVGTAVRLEMTDTPKYIEHLRDEHA